VTGWQAALASSTYVTGTLFQGFIEIVNPSYNPKLWHATLLLYGTVLFGVFCTTKLDSLLPKLEIGLLIIYVCGFFAVFIPIVYLGPHASAKDVFTTFINAGGWSSQTLSFFIGISGNAFTFLGADALYHVSGI
jgi:choline transport protein